MRALRGKCAGQSRGRGMGKRTRGIHGWHYNLADRWRHLRSPRNDQTTISGSRPHIIIVGAGFGGLTAAKNLADEPVTVTIVDGHNYHLFQPLLYQIATASLSPADITSPIRSILSKQRNAIVLMADVTAVDLAKRKVVLANEDELTYDFLILSAGAEPSYFGHEGWAELAPGLKSIEDALEMRRRIFGAFEEAERHPESPERSRLLTFMVVGGGPTGVELAGALGEIAHDSTLRREFRFIDPDQARIILIEGGPRLLDGFPERLSRSAERDLGKLGVEVRTNARVTAMEPEAVSIGPERIEAATILWAAGVRASPLAQSFGLPLDRGGRVIVQSDLTVSGHPEVFVIGDLAATHDNTGKPLPGVAPVAIQQGEWAARNIGRVLAGQTLLPFHYHDKGTLATIGRNRAVAYIFGRTFDGFPAWVLWAGVHIFTLIGFRNRIAVSLQWFWAYVTHQRVARLITRSSSISDKHRITADTSQSSTASGGRLAQRVHPEVDRHDAQHA
jgi:NADH:ubiquinone reductase (H+-translocating)